MRNIRSFFLGFIFFSCALKTNGQDKVNYHFGKLEPADFIAANKKIDSGASAVIIADIGSTSFEGNNQGFFTLVFKRFIRVRIASSKNFSVGDYSISLYHQKEDFEKLYSIKGSTFNLENGTITETKLDEKSIFNQKYNQDLDQVKFSMPALKAGSIYDLEYVIKSPFHTRLRPWTFQGEYPCYWSEYVVTIPPPFHYVVNRQGDTSFYIRTQKDIFGSFLIKYENGPYQSQEERLTGSSLEHRWVKKDVPAIRSEPYVPSLKNYYSRLMFQLNYFQWETGYSKNDRIDFLENWTSTSKTLLQHENFGLVLNYENSWMKEDLKDLNLEGGSSEQRVKKVFEFVRDNFKTRNKEGYDKNSIWTQNSLRDVFKKREGNVAEINLLLTSMLRHAGFAADPLILSTSDHGMASAVYPIIDEYNYVVCVVIVDGKPVILDASNSCNGFGNLPAYCYNGWGHILNLEKPVPLLFSPDSISDNKVTSVFITNDEKGQSSGVLKTTFGIPGSFTRRMEIKNSSEKYFQAKMQTSLISGIAVENFGIDSLYKYDYPLGIHYDFELKDLPNEDLFHLNPMLDEGFKTNPFPSIERHFPVEMPYKIDDTYLLNMEIPTGYQVDELPKSARVAYNETEGSFEYLIQKNETHIQMRVHLKFNKAYFPLEEYADLRDFFAFVVKKENEQIFFKKIK